MATTWTPRRRGAIALAGATLGIDQATKLAALALVPAAPMRIDVLPFLDLTLVWNYGVSFGMFGGGGVPAWVLIALSLAIVAVMAAWAWRADTGLAAMGLALIIGGALGNVIDRVAYGAVVDFLLLYRGSWSWPVFNIADTAITLGVVAILADGLWPGRQRTK